VAHQAKELVLGEKAKEVNELLGGLIRSIFDDGAFKASPGELLTLYPVGKLTARRVVVVGLGDEKKMDTQSVRRASAIAARSLQQTGAHQLALALHSEDWDIALDESVRAEVEGTLLGLYTFTKYKQSDTNGNGRGITRIDLLTNHADVDRLDQARKQGIAL